MVEKLKVFSDCEICGKNYWLKDLVKVKRETVGYDYTGKLGGKMKQVVDCRITYICKECAVLMDKGEGAQGQLVDQDGFPAMRL